MLTWGSLVGDSRKRGWPTRRGPTTANGKNWETGTGRVGQTNTSVRSTPAFGSQPSAMHSMIQRMKTSLVAVATLALATVLTGCGGDGKDSGASGSPSQDVREKSFLEVVHEDSAFEGTKFAEYADADKVKVARSACSDMRNGASWAAVIKAAMDGMDMDAYQAGRFSGVSIGAFCPEQDSQVPQP